MDKELRDIPVKEPAQLAQSRMKYVIIGGICAAALLIVALLVAIFAMRSSREAKNQVKILSGELETASSALTQLQGHYDTLEASHNDLSTQFGELKTAHTELEARHEALRGAYEELEAAYNELVEENNKLKTDVETAELDAEIRAMEKEMVGIYRPESVDGVSMGIAQIIYKLRGGEGKLAEMYSVELKEEGQGIFLNDGKEEAITWQIDGSKLILETETMISEATYADGRITIEVEGMEVVLAKNG